MASGHMVAVIFGLTTQNMSLSLSLPAFISSSCCIMFLFDFVSLKALRMSHGFSCRVRNGKIFRRWTVHRKPGEATFLRSRTKKKKIEMVFSVASDHMPCACVGKSNFFIPLMWTISGVACFFLYIPRNPFICDWNECETNDFFILRSHCERILDVVQPTKVECIFKKNLLSRWKKRPLFAFVTSGKNVSSRRITRDQTITHRIQTYTIAHQLKMFIKFFMGFWSWTKYIFMDDSEDRDVAYMTLLGWNCWATSE